MERASEQKTGKDAAVSLPPVARLAVMINKSVPGKELTDYGCEVTNALFREEWFDHLHDAARSFIKCLRSGRPVRLDRWFDKYEKIHNPGNQNFYKGYQDGYNRC